MTGADSALRTALLDLLSLLSGSGIPLILGGGYGLYLKRERAVAFGLQTLIQPLPVARSTEDIDLFLRTEVVADAGSMLAVRRALDEAGFRPIDSARFYQFARPLHLPGGPASVKVDLLTGSPTIGVDLSRIQRDSRRWRPKGPGVAIHAHPTPEAIALDVALEPFRVDGALSAGTAHSGEVLLPNVLSFALMKLHAFWDRRLDPAKDFGAHHAYDLLLAMALSTEPELNTAANLARRHAHDSPLLAARTIRDECFGTSDGIGVERLQRRYPLVPPGDAEQAFAALRDLLAGAA